MTRILLALSAAALMSAQPAVAAGDAAAGKASYAVCGSCHGVNGEGNKALNAPALAGQMESYLARQVSNFKAGIRGADPKDSFGAQKRPMAMTLADDAAIANVSAYLASLPEARPAATLGGNADAGKALYGVCGACHGVNGEGNKALNGPNLRVLQDWYAVRQLANFKAGIRGAHPKDSFGAQMRPMAMTLADEQAMKDVSAYIATLGR